MTGYDRAEYETWVAQTEASYGPMALLRARDVGKAEAVADLKGEGYRIVKLEHYDTFLDDDPDSVSCGTHQDAFMVREEL